MTADNMPERTLSKSLEALAYHMGHGLPGDSVDIATVRKAASTLTHLEEENARLREALEWYAHQAALMGKITIDANFAQDRLKADRGTRARTALSASEGEG